MASSPAAVSYTHLALIVLALGLLVYRVADGLMGRALLNAARPAAAYSVDARLFDGG